MELIRHQIVLLSLKFKVEKCCRSTWSKNRRTFSRSLYLILSFFKSTMADDLLLIYWNSKLIRLIKKICSLIVVDRVDWLKDLRRNISILFVLSCLTTTFRILGFTNQDPNESNNNNNRMTHQPVLSHPTNPTTVYITRCRYHYHRHYMGTNTYTV